MRAALLLFLCTVGCSLAACADLEFQGELEVPSPDPTSTPVGGGSISVTASCDEPYEISAWSEVTSGGAELVVVGIYEAAGNVIEVHIDRPGAVILVVSAYHATAWNVTAAAGTTLQRVIHNGYEEQTVNVPGGGVPIEDRSGPERIVNSAYDWADADSTQLASVVEGLTGRPLTAFGGCYRAAGFDIGAVP